MARIIKFRAWDKVIKSMRYGAEHSLTMCLMNPNDFEVMQYTGLKDKKDKEIYEGDILLVPNHSTMSDPMGESSFCPVVVETGAFGYRQGFMFESFISLYGHGCKSVDEEEVIGNLYENPELLEGK